MRPSALVEYARTLCKGERRTVLQLPSCVATRRFWSALRIHETGIAWWLPHRCDFVVAVIVIAAIESVSAVILIKSQRRQK